MARESQAQFAHHAPRDVVTIQFGGADRLRKFGPGGRHAGLDEVAIDDQPELERIHR